MRSLRAALLADLSPLLQSGSLLDWSVDLDGVVAALTAKKAPEYRHVDAEGFSRFMGESPRDNHYTAHFFEEGAWRAVRLKPTRENFTSLRRLPDANMLLERGRYRPRERPNGVIYGPDGREVRRVLLGDAIEHLRIGADGSIWIGYFDEGYHQKTRWAGTLARVSPRGKVLFSCRRDAPARLDLDCYQLNVQPDGSAFAATYSTHQLLHISASGKARVLGTLPSSPFGALAVRDRTVMQWDTPRRVFQGEFGFYLSRIGATRRAGVRVVTSRGRVLKPEQVLGVGSTLYVLAENLIYGVETPGATPPTKRRTKSR